MYPLTDGGVSCETRNEKPITHFEEVIFIDSLKHKGSSSDNCTAGYLEVIKVQEVKLVDENEKGFVKESSHFHPNTRLCGGFC